MCTRGHPHGAAPPPHAPARLKESPAELVEYLAAAIAKDLKPRDIVVRDSIRNAVIVAMAIGGSTNVVLHAPEIARAAGYADLSLIHISAPTRPY